MSSLIHKHSGTLLAMTNLVPGSGVISKMLQHILYKANSVVMLYGPEKPSHVKSMLPRGNEKMIYFVRLLKEVCNLVTELIKCSAELKFSFAENNSLLFLSWT